MSSVDTWAPIIFTSLGLARGTMAILLGLVFVGIAVWASDRSLMARLTLGAAGVVDTLAALVFAVFVPLLQATPALSGLPTEQFKWLLAAQSTASFALHGLWLALLGAAVYLFARIDEPDVSERSEF